MILPDDVLWIIKEFARPIGLRLDWRRCKRKESGRIHGSNRALLYWYKWILGCHRDRIHPLYLEVQDWTFYGRRHLLYESRRRFWTDVSGEPSVQDREWYEKRFMLLYDGSFSNIVFPLEMHMAGVSLIV
jgi:hypothetical protein